jgi:hypothetical protein
MGPRQLIKALARRPVDCARQCCPGVGFVERQPRCRRLRSSVLGALREARKRGSGWEAWHI